MPSPPAAPDPPDAIPVPDGLTEREAELYIMAYRRGASAGRKDGYDAYWRQR
jgi:hypothetical protein